MADNARIEPYEFYSHAIKTMKPGEIRYEEDNGNGEPVWRILSTPESDRLVKRLAAKRTVTACEIEGQVWYVLPLCLTAVPELSPEAEEAVYRKVLYENTLDDIKVFIKENYDGLLLKMGCSGERAEAFYKNVALRYAYHDSMTPEYTNAYLENLDSIVKTELNIMRNLGGE